MKENTPDLWKKQLPLPKGDGHKYDRGHAVVVGGGKVTSGAARLAAEAALRIGAGLVTISCEESALQVYAASLLSVMTRVHETVAEFDEWLADHRITALLIGPGSGVNERTRQFTLAALAKDKPCVIDADAISCFEGYPHDLFEHIKHTSVLTPHEGEFKRLFPQLSGTREERAAEAAKLSGAIVILKGAQTVVAAPSGAVVINKNAPPTLATAGSGDVLAGMVTGLIAAKMPAFEAACASVWLHGQAAKNRGFGLIAEDLLLELPKVLQAMV